MMVEFLHFFLGKIIWGALAQSLAQFFRLTMAIFGSVVELRLLFMMAKNIQPGQRMMGLQSPKHCVKIEMVIFGFLGLHVSMVNYLSVLTKMMVCLCQAPEI